MLVPSMKKGPNYQSAKRLLKETLPSRALVFMVEMGEVRRDILETLEPPVDDRTVINLLERTGVQVEQIIEEAMDAQIGDDEPDENEDIWDLVSPNIVNGEENPLVAPLRAKLEEQGVLKDSVA